MFKLDIPYIMVMAMVLIMAMAIMAVIIVIDGVIVIEAIATIVIIHHIYIINRIIINPIMFVIGKEDFGIMDVGISPTGSVTIDNNFEIGIRAALPT